MKQYKTIKDFVDDYQKKGKYISDDVINYFKESRGIDGFKNIEESIKISNTIEKYKKDYITTANNNSKIEKAKKEGYNNYKKIGDKYFLTKDGEETVIRITKKDYDNNTLTKPRILKKQEVETINKTEVLPKDIKIEDEAKKVGAKRISPDRIIHHQLNSNESIAKIKNNISNIIKEAQIEADGYMKRYNDISGNQKKYDDYLKYKEKIEKGEGTPAIEKYVNNNKDYFRRLKLKLDMQNILGKEYKNFKEGLEKIKTLSDDDIKKSYIDLVKKDISKGYKFPKEILDYDKSFKTAIDNRARYEKGLNTSFSADDSRIIFDDRLKIGIKRQDGKELTQLQKDEIVDGINDIKKATGIDLENLLKDDKIVIAHLNGKQPFLKKQVSGLYRQDVNGNKSVSVGGVETFKEKNLTTGEMEIKKINTTMSHELGHTLDYITKNKLFNDFITKYKYNFNTEGISGRSLTDYWRSNEELKARLLAQYVDVKKGSIKTYNNPGNWSKDIFDEVIPSIEKSLKEYFGDYINTPTKSINNKSGFINPGKIFEDFYKAGKYITNPTHIKELAQNIVKGMKVSLQYSKQAINDVIQHIKTYGPKAKDMFYKVVEKINSYGRAIKTELLKSGKDKSYSNLRGSIGSNKELEPLINEAKKYKTFDEFKEGQGREYYRGGLAYNKNLLTERGLSITKDKEIAEDFTRTPKNPKIYQGGEVLQGQKGVIENIYIDKNAKVLHIDNVPKELKKYYQEDDIILGREKIVKYAKDNKFDVVDFGGNDFELRILNGDKIKTESQLKQIYEQSKPKLLKKD